jgi:restriction endonuclease S subunit
MQLKGYWRDRSSGASSTMKKITRTQMNAVVLPLPPVDEQRQIAARLHGQLAEIDRAKDALAAQRKAIDALPAALLREVFGELIAA